MLDKVVLSLLSLPINIYIYPNIKQKHLAYFMLLTHALHNFKSVHETTMIFLKPDVKKE